MTNAKTTVQKQADFLVTGEDARLFILFRNNREKFLALLEGGLFDLDSGRAVVNVHNGQVQSVHVDRMTYKRRTEFSQPPP